MDDNAFFKDLDNFQKAVGDVSFVWLNFISTANWRASQRITGWKAYCKIADKTYESQVRNTQQKAFYSLVDDCIENQKRKAQNESLLLEKLASSVTNNSEE